MTAVLVTDRARSFDVVCAGQPFWHGLDGTSASLFRVARTLARSGVRVGLSTTLEDGTRGRAARSELAAMGVDVDGVRFAAASGLVVVDAAGGQSVTSAGEDTAVEVPPGWASRVLLLSGLSVVTARLAIACKAARRARKQGTVVVIDMIGNLREWANQEPRVISMLLREADVVRCSFVDLAVIGMDARTVRAAMRPSATLVIDDARETVATGPFGEVRLGAGGAGGRDSTAAICAELARPQQRVETASGRWYRTLRSEPATR